LENSLQLSDNDPIEEIIRGEKFNILLYIYIYFLRIWEAFWVPFRKWWGYV